MTLLIKEDIRNLLRISELYYVVVKNKSSHVE